ncbi:MAG: hypothetical protein IJ391_07030 [Clostridia bacterium]|nr:hypothetical protein [Clostridia bacterium]
MLYTYKIGTKHIAFENRIMKLYVLSELEAQISDFVGEDMPKTCPSALRYALAKYDSHTIDTAYAHVYAMRTNSEADGKDIVFGIPEGHTDALVSYKKSAPSLYKDVIALADSGRTHIEAYIIPEDEDPVLAEEYEKIAREVYKRKRQGKPFCFLPFCLSHDLLRIYNALSPLEKKRVQCALFTQI